MLLYCESGARKTIECTYFTAYFTLSGHSLLWLISNVMVLWLPRSVDYGGCFRLTTKINCRMEELVQSLFGGRLAEDLKLSSIIANALFTERMSLKWKRLLHSMTPWKSLYVVASRYFLYEEEIVKLECRRGVVNTERDVGENWFLWLRNEESFIKERFVVQWLYNKSSVITGR